MMATVADVVRALLIMAPPDVEARRWLKGMLAHLGEESPAVPITTVGTAAAPHASAPVDFGPFADEVEVKAALEMLKVGANGRQIAEDFGLSLPLVSEWVSRQRVRAA